jgi:hypothetical protein
MVRADVASIAITVVQGISSGNWPERTGVGSSDIAGYAETL